MCCMLMFYSFSLGIVVFNHFSLFQDFSSLIVWKFVVLIFLIAIKITNFKTNHCLACIGLCHQLKFSFQKVSVHRNEQNGQEEHIKSHEDKLCLPRSVHGVSVM